MGEPRTVEHSGMKEDCQTYVSRKGKKVEPNVMNDYANNGVGIHSMGGSFKQVHDSV